MHARERIIRERFATQTCSDCGHAYAQGNVLVLARRRSAWMVLVTCEHCDHRGIYVVSFPSQPQLGPGQWEAEEPQIASFEPRQPRAERVRRAPVSLDDVTRIRDFLAHFDGNFKRLFTDESSPSS
ncbi:MAG: hypothetical protein PVSMB4_00450 [Ktedonobacterales bacterium]